MKAKGSVPIEEYIEAMEAMTEWNRIVYEREAKKKAKAKKGK